MWHVELRKLVDTRVGVALVIVGALLAGVFGGGAALLRDGQTFGDIARMAAVPGATLVPILTILLVTAERSHHTALSTYLLVPQRGRVLVAKALASGTLGLAVLLLSLLAGAIITPVAALLTGQSIPWQMVWPEFGLFAVGVMLSAISGWALGLGIANAPAAIVVVLIWPMVASIVATVGEPVAEVPRWLDITAVTTLPGDHSLTAVARVAVGIIVWIGIPAAIGCWRTLNREVE